jgi:hypothetical protein
MVVYNVEVSQKIKMTDRADKLKIDGRKVGKKKNLVLVAKQSSTV